MAESAPLAQFRKASPHPETAASVLRLELRQERHVLATLVTQAPAVVLGTVAGCDLRLPSTDLPPLVCLLSWEASGVRLRKLAAALPLLVNGNLCSETLLRPQDRIQIGSFEVQVFYSLPPSEEPDLPPSFAQQRKLLEEGLRKLEQAQRQFEEDRRDWEQDAERQAEALALRSRQLLEREQAVARASNELARSEQAVAERQRLLDAQAADLARLSESLAAQRVEVDREREELRKARTELHEHYSRRRDAVAALRQAVTHAALKVQEEKRRLDADRKALAAEMESLRQQQHHFQEVRSRLDEDKRALQRQAALLEEWHREVEQELAERQKRLEAAEAALRSEQDQLRLEQETHRRDLVHLERRQARLAEEQERLELRARQLDERAEVLRREAAELEVQASQVQDWEKRVQAEAEELARQRAELDRAMQELSAKAGLLDAEQVVLIGLRSRAERLQSELVAREEQLVRQRLRLDEMESRLKEALRLQAEQESALRVERAAWQAEREQIEGRCRTLEEALDRLRQLQATFETEQQARAQLQEQLELRQRELDEKTEQLRKRSLHLHALRIRLKKAKRELLEREAAAEQADQTRQALQDQLRKRAESLAERELHLEAREQSIGQIEAELSRRLAEVEQERNLWAEEQQRRQAELDQRAAALVAREAELTTASAATRHDAAEIERIRAALESDQARWEEDRRRQVEELARQRQEMESLRQTLPNLIGEAQAILSRLSRAREQLRGHLSEFHRYTEQALTELETGQRLVAEQADQVRQERAALVRMQEEHRAAVGQFRQSLLEWQEQLNELKSRLARDESALERKQADLEQQARHIDAVSSQLAQRAEKLEHQERRVARQRAEINHHLADMQRWYRSKLRELAEHRLLDPVVHCNPEADEPRAEARPTGDVPSNDDPGRRSEPALAIHDANRAAEAPVEASDDDRRLSDLLLNMALIDTATLEVLLREARQRHRSLRQVLLEGEYLTAYQMELIEAGRLEALVLGPLRVVDRLRLTPLESVYRVFDPRRGQEAVLRCLSPKVEESRRAEFRQGFEKAAQIQHPHLAATWEVLDIEDCPAALQEWVIGLPSTEWADLAAPPDIWIDLMIQSVDAIKAAHTAGLHHRRLTPNRFLLTEDGDLRICGFGEPPWLSPETDVRHHEPDDWKALGKAAARWLTLGRSEEGSTSVLAAMQSVVRSLVAPESTVSAERILEMLQSLRQQVPENAEARTRLRDRVRLGLGEEEASAPRAVA